MTSARRYSFSARARSPLARHQKATILPALAKRGQRAGGEGRIGNLRDTAPERLGLGRRRQLRQFADVGKSLRRSGSQRGFVEAQRLRERSARGIVVALLLEETSRGRARTGH